MDASQSHWLEPSALALQISTEFGVTECARIQSKWKRFYTRNMCVFITARDVAHSGNMVAIFGPTRWHMKYER